LTAQILSTHFDAVNAKCANASGRMDHQDKIQKAKEFLLARNIFHNILNHDQINAVEFRWCNINNIAGLTLKSDGITVSKNRVYLDDNRKNDTIEQLIPLVAHELYHVSQLHAYDYGGFKCRYGSELLAGHGFGRDNNIEQPAYEFADKIVVGKIGGKYCLDVHAPDMQKNGAKVQIWGCNFTAQQKWKIENKSIKNEGGLCLDAHVTDMHTNGGRIQVWDCNGALQQQWTHDDNDRLVNGGGLCLDIASNLNADGVKVQLWQCNSQASQRWNIFSNMIASTN